MTSKDSGTSISRRRFLRVAAAGIGGLGMGSLLAACGGAAAPAAGTTAEPAGAAAATHSASNGTDSSNGAEKSYTVKSGDNLMKIAKVNGITVKSLRSANALKTDQIKVGQKLKIPSKAAASEPAGPAPGTPTVTTTNPTQ